MGRALPPAWRPLPRVVEGAGHQRPCGRSADVERGVVLKTSLTPLFAIGVLCSALQIASATWLVADFETPNLSTALARQLVRSGEYSVPAHLLPLQFEGDRRQTPIRAYVLPGEPLLLAAAFQVLPAPLYRYIHVPVTVTFVVAIAAVALFAAGRFAAVAAGAIASLDPFIVQHGPVWDDALLAAALQWSFLAIVFHRLSSRPVSRLQVAPIVAAVALAGGAAFTRLQPQIELAIIGVVLLAYPHLRAARGLGAAAITGVALAATGWGMRNALVLGTLLLGTSHDGVTLWQSNHSRAIESIFETGTTQTLAPTIRDPGGDELEISSALRRDALTYLQTNPGEAFVTAAMKVGVSVLGLDFGSTRLGRNAVAASSSVVLCVAALVGWRRWRRDEPSEALLQALGWCAVIVGAVTLVMLAAGPVGIRYRIVATGFAYVFAGIGISAMLAGWRSAPRRAPAL